MNRFAFPSEWMARNWPRKTEAEEATSLVSDFVPIVEIRFAGAVMQVAGKQILQSRQYADIEQADAHATLYRTIELL